MADDQQPPSNTTASSTVATKAAGMDVNHLYYLSSSDSPGMTLVNNPFDGKGYQGWRRSILIALSTKNKLEFITGDVVVPTADSPDLPIWSRCNDMVTSWLLNSRRTRDRC